MRAMDGVRWTGYLSDGLEKQTIPSCGRIVYTHAKIAG